MIECEHRGAAWLAERFGLSRGTVIRRSIHGTWPHAEPPTSGYPSPWFCAHDVQGIAGQVSHDG